MQTCRIVTRALSAATSASSAAGTAAELERLCLANGVSFLSLGGTSDERLLEEGVFHQIAAATDYTSCTFRQAVRHVLGECAFMQLETRSRRLTSFHEC